MPTIDRFEFAVKIARAAGARTLGHFRNADLQVERKADASPVTVADRDAESYLREQISEAYPKDAIVGEEFPDRDGDSGYRWILDPIDGTKSFIHGVPLYGTLVGVEHQGRSEIGVIDIPAMQECVFAAKGRGAWHIVADQPRRPARVSSCERLDEALFVTTSVKGFQKRGAPEVFQRLDTATRLTRTWGDCFGYLMVATGRADLMVDPLLNVWDAAALLPVLEEAGGCFTDWRGEASPYGGDGIGANRVLVEQVLPLTRRLPKPS